MEIIDLREPEPKNHYLENLPEGYTYKLIHSHLKFLPTCWMISQNKFTAFLDDIKAEPAIYFLFRQIKKAKPREWILRIYPNSARYKDPEELVEWAKNLGGILQVDKLIISEK